MTIVYTSGSTGLPKGVVLSFKNIAASAKTSAEQLAVRSDDRYMSYLPLAHITERSLIEWTSIYAGNKVFFVESLDTFIDNVKYAQPTLFLSVPRLWTKFQSEILAKLPDPKLQRLLRLPVIGSLIARKIRAGLGLNKCRLFGSGTAPISPGILQWYNRLNINISEGWGMTETSGLSCVAIPFEQRLLGTIGRPVPCVEMKVSEEEILIRGDSVFQEYYLNPEATKQTFTDGWLHTGDRATYNADGSYKIIGRIKEQFKTAKGKYVAPAPIEGLLGRNPDIEQVCVIGSGRKQPVAIVVLNEQFNVPEDSTHQRLIETLIDVNKELEAHQRLDHLIVSNEAWTIENRLLTPTLKIRRHKLEEHYSHFIDEELEHAVVWQAQLS
jgi:long-subunit acyl-CoA synthetase (AMP-forming)